MFDSRPTRCNCGGTVVYGKMEKFGLRPYQSGYCYICQKCGAYVGTHQNRPKDALGILATGDTRRLRVLCHEEFDKHWMSTAGKSRVYYRLSKEMGIKKEDCHFGYMQKDQLVEALSIIGNITMRDRRRHICEKENGISVIDLCISKYADWVRITIFFT